MAKAGTSNTRAAAQDAARQAQSMNRHVGLPFTLETDDGALYVGGGGEGQQAFEDVQLIIRRSTFVLSTKDLRSWHIMEAFQIMLPTMFAQLLQHIDRIINCLRSFD
jgi:hypothetical protein